MEFRIGDKVRFVTLDPRWSAEHTTDELEIVYIYEDGDLEVSYPNGLTQTVHPDDVEHV